MGWLLLCYVGKVVFYISNLRGLHMSDRFPYNRSARAALVELIRRSDNRPDLRDDYVTFEDMFFSPTQLEPGRTYIEMIDLITSHKDWYEYRRLDLADNRCLGPAISIIVQGNATPANIAREINRSRKMHFGESDVSFSDEIIPHTGNNFEYDFTALSGSYAYYGVTKVSVTVIPTSQWTRYKEDDAIRYTEEGIERELEHKLNIWSV